MSYIATDREGRWGVNSSVFDKKKYWIWRKSGSKAAVSHQDNMKSSYSCSVMMMMMESWSRAVVVFSFRSRSVVDLTSSVVDLTSSVVDAVVSSKRSSNAVLSFSSIITSFTSFWFWSSLWISDPRDDDPSCPRPSYDDGRLCSSFLLVTCVPCLPYVIQNQSGDSRLGQECFVIG